MGSDFVLRVSNFLTEKLGFRSGSIYQKAKPFQGIFLPPDFPMSSAGTPSKRLPWQQFSFWENSHVGEAFQSRLLLRDGKMALSKGFGTKLMSY